MSDTANPERRFTALLIDPAELFRLLDGDVSFAVPPSALVAPAPEYDVVCEGLLVARIRPTPEDAWEVTAVACIGSSHGVHPRFAALTERVAALRERIFGAPPPALCRRCAGTGWIAFESDDARRLRAMARAFGMWRGIIDPNPRQPTREEAMLALDVFLGEATLAGLRDATRPDNAGGDHDGSD